jgi:phosphotransferase system HPr (HPr) family protein
MIVWQDGLHLRVAALVVRLARRFASSVRLRAGLREAEATNIMQLMLLSAAPGTVLRLEASGRDEEEAIAALTRLFADRAAGDVSDACEAGDQTVPPHSDYAERSSRAERGARPV